MYFLNFLNFLNFLKRLQVLLIGENMSIWMTPFRFESSCALDDGMWWIILQRKGGPYLVVGVRGILLPWVILRREGRHDHIWISNFLWRQFWGVVLCPYMAYGRVYPYMGTPQRRGFFGGLKCVSPYYW